MPTLPARRLSQLRLGRVLLLPTHVLTSLSRRPPRHPRPRQTPPGDWGFVHQLITEAPSTLSTPDWMNEGISPADALRRLPVEVLSRAIPKLPNTPRLWSWVVTQIHPERFWETWLGAGLLTLKEQDHREWSQPGFL